MRLTTFIVALFIGLSSFAHRGEFLAIINVEVTETENTFVYSFDVENIHSVEVRDIKIEFVVNTKSVFQKYYPILKAEHKYFSERFEIPKKWINPKSDLIQIEITEIFGKKDDWGGWDSPVFKQGNSPLSDFVADAPWRMNKTNGSGSEQGIPVHIFLHDADEIVGNGNQVDYIDIKIKNATDASFGSALTYSSLSTTDFNNMFSCQSVDDGGLGVRGFDMNSFTSSASNTIDFNEETAPWPFPSNTYVQIDEDFWYFSFTIPPADLAGFGNVIDIEVYVKYDNTGWIPDYDVSRLRVFRSDDALPSQSNFYRGDTHLHSMFTQNTAEIGLPLSGTKQAAQMIGLDWITTTDHTSDFDNYGSGNINTNWAIIKAEAAALNAADPSLIYIPGQEVAVNNSNGDLVHMLAYPSYTSVSTFPFLGDGDGDLSGTSKTVDIVAADLASFDGFSYAAHPFATESELSITVGGGIWNLGHANFPDNSLDFPETGGGIIANDLTADSDILLFSSNKLVKDGIKGAQIWNVRNSLSTTGDANDPWDVLNVSSPFSQTDTTSFSFHIKKFRQAQEITNFINQLGLQLKNQDSSYQNWKLYIAAGADAHGSFNFSNTDDFWGITGTISNNAVGKLNTLTYSENGMGTNGENVLKSLYHGNTTLSDGPILTIGISDDGENSSNEVMMGADAIVNTLTLDDYYFNYNYTTSLEFGDVTKITMIVGTESGEVRKNIPVTTVTGDNLESYSLTDILDLVLGVGNTPQDEYFYIRAELQTFIDYTGSEQTYKTDFDYFHSFTNPIWIKLSEVAIATIPDVAVIGPSPFNESFTLYVENPDKVDVTVEMYNDIGQLIFQEVKMINEAGEEYSAQDLGMSIGMYTVKVYVGNVNKAIKIVKD